MLVMQKTMIDAYSLWAKTKVDDEPGQWHALPYHLVDVGAAASALWARLPSQSLAVPRSALTSEDIARPLVTFLAAAHDIGKANPYFQKKSKAQAGRLKSLVRLPVYDEPARHGQATGAYLSAWLHAELGWAPGAATTVAMAVGGHHGEFFQDTNCHKLGVADEPWRTIGTILLSDLAKLFKVRKGAGPREPLNPFLAWLAGFVSVADWLGSHADMTGWKTDVVSLEEYYASALGRAHQMLNRLQWQQPTAAPMRRVGDLLPSGVTPHSMQRLAEKVAPHFSLAIIEAPTGEGKTEAAFALCEPGRSAGGGIYFALPTMATANGLHDRVRSYVSLQGSDNEAATRLLHSQAWLFRDDAAIAEDPGTEGSAQGMQAEDWFAGAKRGLLAPYGVGTIDQALIAALRAKHGFVRLFALAGKTVVIDEVHAYDVYMGDILEVLLGWLQALGCRVVLLSATLPRARRLALLRAWGKDIDDPAGDYPCMTWVDTQGTARAKCFDVSPRKPLSIDLLPRGETDVWLQGAERIFEHVMRQGGHGALVLNTVSHAQEAYQWLASTPHADIELDLFHGRFTMQDRNAIERRILAKYGRHGKRKGRSILVATQVVEQSLDLDFDHMVSELAPMDFLVQRAGRLHRHARDTAGTLQPAGAPDQRPNPVLEVIYPAMDAKGIPSDPIYSQDVLFRTFPHIKDRVEILHPADVSKAIEAVYSEKGRESLLKQERVKLATLEAERLGKTAKQRSLAQRASIYPANDSNYKIVDTWLILDEHDERDGSRLSARTRLEDRPSVTVCLLESAQTTCHGASSRDARSVLFASVGVAPPYPLWEQLTNLKPLPAWHKHRSLRRLHPVILTGNEATIGEYIVSYSSTLGLRWRKEDGDVSTG